MSSAQTVALDIPTDVSIDNSILLKDNHKRRVVSIDINSTKTWIAYLTREYDVRNSWGLAERRRRTNIAWYITISSFDSVATVIGTGRFSYATTHLDKDSNGDSIFDAFQSCSFLSVSPDGRRVAFSFLAINHRNTIEDRGHEYDALILDTNTSGTNEYGFVKKIPCQGRAVFLNDEQLALINEQHLKIYDKKYNVVQQFNIKDFSSPLEEKHHTYTPSWVGYPPEHLRRSTLTLASNIIAISRHIQKNVLITPYKSFVHV